MFNAKIVNLEILRSPTTDYHKIPPPPPSVIHFQSRPIPERKKIKSREPGRALLELETGLRQKRWNAVLAVNGH